MGRSAESKLDEADRLDTRATRIVKRDPESARSMRDLAHAKRKSAIKQMRRRPKASGGSKTRVIV